MCSVSERYRTRSLSLPRASQFEQLKKTRSRSSWTFDKSLRLVSSLPSFQQANYRHGFVLTMGRGFTNDELRAMTHLHVCCVALCLQFGVMLAAIGKTRRHLNVVDKVDVERASAIFRHEVPAIIVSDAVN